MWTVLLPIATSSEGKLCPCRSEGKPKWLWRILGSGSPSWMLLLEIINVRRNIRNGLELISILGRIQEYLILIRRRIQGETSSHRGLKICIIAPLHHPNSCEWRHRNYLLKVLMISCPTSQEKYCLWKPCSRVLSLQIGMQFANFPSFEMIGTRKANCSFLIDFPQNVREWPVFGLSEINIADGKYFIAFGIYGAGKPNSSKLKHFSLPSSFKRLGNIQFCNFHSTKFWKRGKPGTMLSCARDSLDNLNTIWKFWG